MGLNSTWRPAEDNMTIVNERTWLAGILVACAAYGIVFILFVLSFKQLLKTTTRANLMSKLPLLIYISLIFTSGTLFIGSASKMIQLGFIDYRLFPGGPAAFEMEEFSISVNEIANVTYVFTNWLMVIFRGCHYPEWFVMGIPALAYLGSISLGIVWLIQVSAPASSPWSTTKTTINVTLPYFWLSLVLNIIMTIAICARLLYFRWRVTSVLGSMHGSHYTSIAAMCVESALIYSIFALCFVVSFSLNHPVQYTFLQALGEVQVRPAKGCTFMLRC
ncbi:hypothetical protein BDZ97DRAFT_620443 [Flammula alnicola]|nr:hypothetical protein BDZ97DRAFT_620443 [Flammula alnicola]